MYDIENELLEKYKIAIDKAEVILGFDDVEISENTDEARQIVAFVIQEVIDFLYVENIKKIHSETILSLYRGGYHKLVKILETLNVLS